MLFHNLDADPCLYLQDRVHQGPKHWPVVQSLDFMSRALRQYFTFILKISCKLDHTLDNPNCSQTCFAYCLVIFKKLKGFVFSTNFGLSISPFLLVTNINIFIQKHFDGRNWQLYQIVTNNKVVSLSFFTGLSFNLTISKTYSKE